MTGKAWIFDLPLATLDLSPAAQLPFIDALLAERLADPVWLGSTAVLHPLPVLGVPGWTDENGEPSYYDDPWQFRKGRRPRP